MPSKKKAVAPDSPPIPHLSLESALGILQQVQEFQGSRQWRMVVRTFNPGGLSAHQTTEVQGFYAGMDWEAGMVVIEPSQPLTALNPEQVEAISKSVREGSSWHAYQRDRVLRERITALEKEVATLRAAANPPQVDAAK